VDAELVMLAARLVQCASGDVLAARWRGDDFVVVWGIGWKKVFPRAEVDLLTAKNASYVGRAQMIIAPEGPAGYVVDPNVRTMTVTAEDNLLGLYALFADRVAMTLIRAGLESPGAVQATGDEELLAIGGIGPRTLKDIRDVLPYSQQVSDTVEG